MTNNTNSNTNGNTGENTNEGQQRLFPIVVRMEENGGLSLTYPTNVDLFLEGESAYKTKRCIIQLMEHEGNLRNELDRLLKGKQNMSPSFVKAVRMKICQGDKGEYHRMQAQGLLDISVVNQTVDWMISNRMNKLKETIAKIAHNKAYLKRQEEAIESKKQSNNNNNKKDGDEGDSRGFGEATGMAF